MKNVDNSSTPAYGPKYMGRGVGVIEASDTREELSFVFPIRYLYVSQRPHVLP